MLNRLLQISLLGAVCFCGGLYASRCVPSCVVSSFLDTKQCVPAGGKVEDPMNCTQFYYCLSNCEPAAYPVPCYGGSFDPIVGDCNGLPDCIESCRPGNCHLSCNGTMDLINDTTNCSRYYICLPHGADGPYSCPTDAPYFNGDSCVTESSECCEANCFPWCEMVGVEIPDPMNCTKYYICVSAGEVASEDFHFSCPPGENFDKNLGRCTPTAQCEILCTAAKTG